MIAVSRRVWLRLGVLAGVVAIIGLAGFHWATRKKLREDLQTFFYVYYGERVEEKTPRELLPKLIYVRAEAQAGLATYPTIPDPPTSFSLDIAHYTVERAGELLKRIDSHWAVTPETRQAIPLLVRLMSVYPAAGQDSLKASLSEIDPGWRQSKEAREQIPWLLNAYVTEKDCEGGNFQAKEETPRRPIRVLQEIDPNWPHSAEANACLRNTLLPQLLGPNWPGIELLARQIEPEWESLPEARALLPQLVKIICDPELQGYDRAVELADRLDPNWKSRDEVKAFRTQLCLGLAPPGSAAERDRALRALAWIERMGPPTADEVAILLKAALHRGEFSLKLLRVLDRTAPSWPRLSQARQFLPPVVRQTLETIEWRNFATSWCVDYQILQRFGPDWPLFKESQILKPDLIRCLRSRNETHVLAFAARAVVRMGKPDQEVVSALNSLLTENRRYYPEPQGTIHQVVAKILGELGAPAKTAVPTLAARMQDRAESLETRIACADALGKLGSVAKHAVPQLQQVAADAKLDPVLRTAAEHALGKISPQM